jgi:hypothetical protein
VGGGDYPPPAPHETFQTLEITGGVLTLFATRRVVGAR